MKRVTIYIFVALIAIAGIIGTLFLISTKNEVVLTEKSYKVEGEEVQSINIDVRDSEIEVGVSEDNQIHINYLESDKEFYDISIAKDKTLNMISNSNKEWKDFIGNSTDRKIVLLLPDTMMVDLKLATTNEDIKLVNLKTMKSVYLRTNNGDIKFKNLDVEKNISLTAKNGNVKGSIVGGYDDFSIACKVKKGECNLPIEKKNGHKKLTVDINNGDAIIDINK